MAKVFVALHFLKPKVGDDQSTYELDYTGYERQTYDEGAPASVRFPLVTDNAGQRIAFFSEAYSDGVIAVVKPMTAPVQKTVVGKYPPGLTFSGDPI